MKQTYVRTATLVALSFTVPAFASLYEVDSPEIADRIELKTGIYYRNAATSDLLVFPTLELQAPAARDLEIEVDGGYGHEVQTNGRRLRVGRATVEMKWRFLSGDRDHPSLALIPELTVPLRGSSASADQPAMKLEIPIVLEKGLGPLMVDVRAGYGRELESQGESFVPVGVLVRYRINPSLEIGAEATGELPCQDLEDPSLSLDVGLKWKATGRLEFQGLVGRTMRSSALEEESLRIKLEVVTAL